MGRYHFCRRFCQVTGAAFPEYFYYVRLSQVYCLLTGETALRWGVSSMVHLTRVFRKQNGTTSVRFRKSSGKMDS